MSQNKKAIWICKWCGNHNQGSDYQKHLDKCILNPDLKGCGTCDRNINDTCSSKLLPIDFKYKRKGGRDCLSWKEKSWKL